MLPIHALIQLKWAHLISTANYLSDFFHIHTEFAEFCLRVVIDQIHHQCLELRRDGK